MPKYDHKKAALILGKYVIVGFNQGRLSPAALLNSP